jgi:S1/P1 Nuclease
MKPGRVILLLLLSLVARAGPVFAWDYFGHHVVGAIAWEHMDPSARSAVAALLLKAPSDSDLPSLLPPAPMPMEERQRELFLKAQGWADLVRDELWPERKAKYDHPAWHYVNHFWKEEAGGPRKLEERGTLGELVLRLDEARRNLSDRSMDDSERALALAWVLHLTGDIHQPLHSSARVTPLDPKGDRGGNDFLLDDIEAPNLHAFWDMTLGQARRQHPGEAYFAWVQRVADELTGKYPRESLREELSRESADEWSRQAAEIAMSSAYPDYLTRGAAPPRRYQDEVFETASRQAALAGYRLARLLDEAFAGAPLGPTRDSTLIGP